MDDTLLRRIDRIDWLWPLRFVITWRHYIFGGGLILGATISYWYPMAGQRILAFVLGSFLMVIGTKDYVADDEEELMILSDESIREQVAGGRIGIDPEPTESQFQPSSLDLRLGDEYYDVYIDEYESDNEVIVVRPSSFYLCHTQESVSLPDDVSAMVSGRSSFGRDGIIVHCTAGFVDAGFAGDITLEVFNFNNEPVTLTVGERICQLVFFPLDNPAQVPYSEQRGSHYQGQSGATKSRR